MEECRPSDADAGPSVSDSQSQEKKRRCPNFSEAEKMELLHFVAANKNQLMGKAGRPGHGDDKVEARKAAAWRRCAASVNQIGGNSRNWKQIKKQWQSLQDKAKRSKHNREQTGGGPKQTTAASVEFAMEVVAREALEGIKSKATEIDPLGRSLPELSQDSSQETQLGGTKNFEASNLSESASIQSELHNLRTQIQTLKEAISHPSSAVQRATEIRQMKIQEELLKIEKKKLELQEQSLEVQQKMLAAIEIASANALLRCMTEQ